jgi:hypothetical protein
VGTNVAVVTTFTRAHWRWVVGALVAFALLLGGKCYGDAQYARGQALARASIADSLGRVYEARYQAFRDSTTRQMDAFKASLAAANARADAADARATAAIQHAASIPPEIIARTPPEVLTAMNELQTALVASQASNRELSAKLVDASTLLERARTGLALADSALARKDSVIVAYKNAKDPAHGFWHTVGVVAKYTGAGALGVIAGTVIAH